MNFCFEPTITKEYLLSKFSQEVYLEFYLKLPVRKGLFRSPLREDPHPTCSFFKAPNGDIYFKDFNGSFCGNFINVVMKIYNCTYFKALKIIAIDFGLIKDSKPNSKIDKLLKESKPFKDEAGPAKIQVQIKDFSEKELKWWNSYGITQNILNRFRVFSCNSVFLNSQLISVSTESNPIYGYFKGKKNNVEYWRIYFPKRKEYRFLSNWSSKMIQGLNQLPKNGDLLVITKSLKDVMCLYSLGINAIAPNSETLFLSEKQFINLKAAFKKIVLLYDNDLAGISNMNKIRKQFNIPCYWLPRTDAKDISDYYKKFGKDKTLQLIQNTIKLWQ